MPKLKTVKSVSKRLSVSGNGKLRKKTAGQDHFNSREPGKVSRNKRRGGILAKVDVQLAKLFIPYAKQASRK